MLLPLGTGDRACDRGRTGLDQVRYRSTHPALASQLRAAGGIKTESRAVRETLEHTSPPRLPHLCTPAPVPVKCRFTARHGKTEGANGSEWERVRDRLAPLARGCVRLTDVTSETLRRWRE